MTYKFCTLSLGSTTSVNLIPKRSPIITTSPLAIIVPLAKISKGSPASLSNSITDPSLILSNSLSFISAPPTSTVSFTSIFSKTFKFSKPVLLFSSTLSEFTSSDVLVSSTLFSVSTASLWYYYIVAKLHSWTKRKCLCMVLQKGVPSVQKQVLGK